LYQNGGIFLSPTAGTPQQWTSTSWPWLLEQGVDVSDRSSRLFDTITETEEVSNVAVTSEKLSLKTVVVGAAVVIAALISAIYWDMRGDITSISSSASETAKALSALTTRVEAGFAELSGKLDVTRNSTAWYVSSPSPTSGHAHEPPTASLARPRAPSARPWLAGVSWLPR
jgi:hypothetical protein